MPVMFWAYLVMFLFFWLDAIFDPVNRGPATLLACMFGGMMGLMLATYPA